MRANEKPVDVIAFTGGPCSGKTKILTIARQFLEDHGFRVCTLHESATEIFSAGFKRESSDWQHDRHLQEFIFLHTTMREDMYKDFMRVIATDKRLVLITDRGRCDGIAYSGRSEFQKMIWEIAHLRIPDLLEKYKAALHLVTTAYGAEKHFSHATNATRTEGLQEARELDDRTKAAWLGHPHFVYIDNSTDWDGKVQRALKGLARVMGIPEPLELERRYVLHGFNPGLIPADAIAVRIEQTYLNSHPLGAIRRVRKRVLDGVSSYYYTEKKSTGVSGARYEFEHSITESEYTDLLTQRDMTLHAVVKDRHHFVVNGHSVELDVVHEPHKHAGLTIAEIEVSDLAEPITLPTEWQAEEVTHKTGYSNYELAAG